MVVPLVISTRTGLNVKQVCSFIYHIHCIILYVGWSVDFFLSVRTDQVPKGMILEVQIQSFDKG